MTSLVFLRTVALAAATIFASSVAALGYPTKPIRLIVPYGPGGSTDVLARIIAQHSAEILGQPVVVENRPGGSSIVGTQLVVQSPPDGHTIMLATIALGANPALFKRLPYDAETQLTPISLVGGVPLVLVANRSTEVKTVAELISLAKSKPGVLNYGSAGTGGANHLAGALFTALTGTDIVPISYKSGGEIATALLGGHVNVAFSTIPTVSSYIASGDLVPLAVSSPTRSPALPDVPTFKDAGLSSYELIDWRGIVGPSGLPDQVVQKLHETFKHVVEKPEVKAQIEKLGIIIDVSTPDAFGSFLRQDIAQWKDVAKKVGIKPE